jgi:hypothetical protein
VLREFLCSNILLVDKRSTQRQSSSRQRRAYHSYRFWVFTVEQVHAEDSEAILSATSLIASTTNFAFFKPMNSINAYSMVD